MKKIILLATILTCYSYYTHSQIAHNYRFITPANAADSEITSLQANFDAAFAILNTAIPRTHISTFFTAVDITNPVRDSIFSDNLSTHSVNYINVSNYLADINSFRTINIHIANRNHTLYLIDQVKSQSNYASLLYNISFIDTTVNILSPFALSKLILYYSIRLDEHSNIYAGLKYYQKVALAKSIADLYNTIYNHDHPGNEEWYDLDVEEKNKMVPYYIYLETKLNDVANIISGPEGKLRASKVDLKFIAPGVNLSFPVARIDTNKLFLQMGGGINFKEPVTEIINVKPNFDMKLNTEFVYVNKAKYTFRASEKQEYLRQLYSKDFGTNKIRRDSLMLNAPWNTKRISFFTGLLLGKWQRLNMIDSSGNLTDSASQHSSGAFTLSLNYQFYHYVSPKNRLLRHGGNKYLKVGFDMSYNNAVANETVDGVKVQTVDTTTDGEKNKVSDEQIAYNRLDVIDKNFTFSPHLDYYMMENSRHFGIHFLSALKFIHLGAGKYDNQLKLGIGLFGSVKNALSADGNVINFELLFTSQNPINTNITTYWKSFAPALKLEFPFNQIKN